MKRPILRAALVLSGLLTLATVGSAQGGRWAKKADLPTPRFGFATAVVNGKIYVMGGATDEALSSLRATVHEYNPLTDRWTKKANMPTERWGFAASAVDRKIYAIGGVVFNRLATVEEATIP